MKKNFDVEKDILNAEAYVESGFKIKSIKYDIRLSDFRRESFCDFLEIFKFMSNLSKAEEIIKETNDFIRFIIMPDCDPYIFFRVGNFRVIYTSDIFRNPILSVDIKWRVSKGKIKK